MAFHFGPEPSTELDDRLRRAASEPLTYTEFGMSLEPGAPDGFRSGEFETQLGWGPGVFDRAVQALHGWQAHRGAGIVVATDGPLANGTNVVMTVPLGVGRLDVECRVVRLVEEQECFGFAYGTLPNHPERGEESFLVERAANGYVTFRIHAVSAHRQPLARAVPPVAGLLQSRYTKRYLRAMERAVGLTD